MADSMAGLSWRTPPVQTAGLFLVVTALAAWNLYGHPSTGVRTFTIVLAVATLAWAVIGMRMHLDVDAEGAAVRFVGRESWLPWSDIERVEVVAGVRGSRTVRFVTLAGESVEVPPSLLQPSKPTKKSSEVARLKAIVARIEEFRVLA